LQYGFNGPTKPRPEFDLAGDGSFEGFARQAGIEDQGVGEFDRLTQAGKEAFRYPLSTDGLRPEMNPQFTTAASTSMISVPSDKLTCRRQNNH
jgi:hypothetical protein